MGRRIVIPGGSGWIGRQLAPVLRDRGDDVVVLTRGEPGERDGVRHVRWDVDPDGDWVRELDGAHAVVHLAGRRVDVRPTRRNLRRLVASRVGSVLAVGAALGRCDAPPQVWVQSSTAAIHGDGGDEVLTDATVPDGLGPPQMVQVAMAWEQAVAAATADVDRTVVLRFAVAVGPGDPATDQLARLVRRGLGGPIAGGQQWFSWIAVEDMVALLVRAIDDDAMRGTYLAAAPTPVTNAEHMRLLRELLGVRVGLPSPRAATVVGALALGADPALALVGRRCFPTRLLAEGFTFAQPTLEPPLRRALGLEEPPRADVHNRGARPAGGT